jgi:hypothetical protein
MKALHQAGLNHSEFPEHYGQCAQRCQQCVPLSRRVLQKKLSFAATFNLRKRCAVLFLKIRNYDVAHEIMTSYFLIGASRDSGS